MDLHLNQIWTAKKTLLWTINLQFHPNGQKNFIDELMCWKKGEDIYGVNLLAYPQSISVV